MYVQFKNIIKLKILIKIDYKYCTKNKFSVKYTKTVENL